MTDRHAAGVTVMLAVSISALCVEPSPGVNVAVSATVAAEPPQTDVFVITRWYVKLKVSFTWFVKVVGAPHVKPVGHVRASPMLALAPTVTVVLTAVIGLLTEASGVPLVAEPAKTSTWFRYMFESVSPPPGENVTVYGIAFDEFRATVSVSETGEPREEPPVVCAWSTTVTS